MALGGALAQWGGTNIPSYESLDQPGIVAHGPAPKANFGGELVHSLQSIGSAVGSGLAHDAGNFVHTAADLVKQGAEGAYHTGAAVGDLATGNTTAAKNQIIKEKGIQDKSFLKQQYGQGNVQSLEHAGEFAATAATIAAPLIAPAADAAEGAGVVAKAGTKVVNAGKEIIGAGKSTGSNPVTAVAGKIVRNALVTQPTAQFAGQAAKNVATGNVKGAAEDAALLAAPEAAGLIGKGLKAGSEALGSDLFGKSAIVNEVFNPKDVEALAKNDPAAGNTLKRVEQFTLNQPDVKSGAIAPADKLKSYMQDTLHINPQEPDALHSLVSNFNEYAPAHEAVDASVKAGELPDNAVASKHPQAFVEPLSQKIYGLFDTPTFTKAGAAERVPMVNKAIDDLGIKNQTLVSDFRAAILNNPHDPEDAIKAIQEVPQKNVIKDLGNGFAAVNGPKERALMPSAADVEGNSLVEGRAPGKIGGKVGNVITKAGLSPRSVPSGEFNASLEDNLSKRFAQNGVNMDAKQALAILKDKASQTTGASDVRMLTNNKIRAAFSTVAPDAEPGAIAKSVRQAYGDVPAAITGGGPKVVNKVMNPLLAQYLRGQGIGKFSANPAFIFGKLPIKGGIVAVAHGADPLQAFIGGGKDVESALKNDVHGSWFAGSREGGSGTVQDELGTTTSGSNQVNGTLRRQITGLVASVAKAQGTTVQDIIDEKGPLYQELQHSVGLIKGYGSGGYLNSPLAKTLNLVIFPSRFDTKVVQSAAKIMGRMSMPQQVATVVAANNLRTFLGSPQGKQWVQQNQAAVNVLSYFTPLDTISGVQQFFTKGFHAQDLGQIGGLPFGVISQILDTEVSNLGKLGQSQYAPGGVPEASPYPTTNGARVQTALSDILSSMFSYPGATLGLQSKNKLIQGVAPILKPASSSIQYKYANGANEGSSGAPASTGPAATAAPLAPPKSTVPANPSPGNYFKEKIVPSATSSYIKPASTKKKTVPLSQQLPGSAKY